MLRETSEEGDNFENKVAEITGKTVGQFISKALDNWFLYPELNSMLISKYSIKYKIDNYVLIFNSKTDLYSLITKE